MVVGSDGSLYVAGATEGYLPLLPGYTPLQANYGGGYADDFLLVLSPAASGLTGATPSVVQADPRKGLEGGTPLRTIRR